MIPLSDPNTFARVPNYMSEFDSKVDADDNPAGISGEVVLKRTASVTSGM